MNGKIELCWLCFKKEAVSFGYCEECSKETRQAIRPWLCKIERS
jgi:hypothetical protein